MGMDWNRHCVAVIPCFNEAAQIRKVVAEVRRHLSSVIVVDDGSTDATGEIARKAGADLLMLAKNRGKGAALQQGWRRAAKLGFEWVLMLDGDGQHAPQDIPKLFARAEASGAPLVVGNRMNNAGEMPFVRRCANRWMSRWISKLTGADLPDSQCGFRLAHLETLLSLSIHANRFEIESAMLVAFLAAGKKVEFVPVQTIYRARASKIHPLADSWRWARWLQAQRAPLRAWSTMRVP
jgi:glycosyltransferase involved in cell wall biosynthesis